MKSRVWLVVVLGVGLVGATGYWLYNEFVGNHVEIKSVIQEEADGAGTNGGSEAGLADHTKWTIDAASEVYLVVATSKEKVNLQAGEVTGDWELDLKNSSDSKATAQVQLATLDSGNGRRDTHIKSAELLDTAQFPEATFVSDAVANWPEELKAGESFSFELTGKLTIRGITKEVTFAMKGKLEDKQIALEGETTITFSEFGMKSPSAVFAKIDEEIEIAPRLILVPATES